MKGQYSIIELARDEFAVKIGRERKGGNVRIVSGSKKGNKRDAEALAAYYNALDALESVRELAETLGTDKACKLAQSANDVIDAYRFRDDCPEPDSDPLGFLA